MRYKYLLLTAAFLLAGSLPVMAQTVPDSTRPENIERKFDQPTLPKSSREMILPEASPQEISPTTDQATFLLENIIVDGSSVYTPDDLKEIYEPLLGQQTALIQVFQIADLITAKYRKDGYLLARVIVPAQTVEAGTIRLQVLEGYIDDVIVEGDIEGDRDIIDGYVAQLKNVRPVTANDIERLILLINELPGVSAKSVLKSSETNLGAATLGVFIENKPFEGIASLDNRGSRYVGPAQWNIRETANSLFGLYDQVSLRYATTDSADELSLFEIKYKQPIGSYGTTLEARVVRSYVQPGFDIGESEINSKGALYSLSLDHPIIRSRSENWNVSTQFDYRNSKTDVLDTLDTRDRTRSLSLGTTYDWVDDWLGINLIGVSATQGFDILDATKKGSSDLSRANGRSDFTKMNFDLSRLQQIDGPFSVLASFTGQYAFSQLLAGQQFSYGGADFGRAYDSSEITGDHGAAFLLELRYNLDNDDPYFSHSQFYASYDVGAAWQIDTNSAQDRTSGASAALGVRFDVTQSLSGDLQVAVPLTKPVSSYGLDGSGPRGYFSLTSQF